MQRGTSPLQTLDITVSAGAGATLVCGMVKLLSIGVLLPGVATAIAVVVAAVSGHWGVAVRSRTFAPVAFSPAVFTFTLLTHVQWVWKGLSFHKKSVLKRAVWTLGAAFPLWCGGVGAGNRRTGPLFTLHSSKQTTADLAGLFGACKPLSVAIDTPVIGATVADGTTGAADLCGVGAVGGGAANVCADIFSIDTSAAGAGVLGMPLRALHVLHSLHNTHFADGAAVLWVDDLIGA